MTVDFPDWAAPQAHADRIANTGAPLLVFKRVIDTQIGTNIPASGTLTRPASGNYSLNQPGYEILLNVASLTNPAPIVSVELQWYDNTFGQLLDDEVFYFYSGNTNGHFIHGRGPTKGDAVVVVVKNYSATGGLTFTYTLLQTSRVYTREFWKTVMKGAVAPAFLGFTAATMNTSANVLGQASQSLAANGTAAFVLPLYTGTVRVYANTGDTTAGNSQWVLSDPTDQVIANSTILSAANGESAFAPFGPTSLYLADTALPRSQCTMTMINKNGTTTETLAFTAIAQENRA